MYLFAFFFFCLLASIARSNYCRYKYCHDREYVRKIILTNDKRVRVVIYAKKIVLKIDNTRNIFRSSFFFILFTLLFTRTRLETLILYVPSSDMAPQTVHMKKLSPIDPVLISSPVGETNIPEPKQYSITRLVVSCADHNLYYDYRNKFIRRFCVVLIAR